MWVHISYLPFSGFIIYLANGIKNCLIWFGFTDLVPNIPKQLGSPIEFPIPSQSNIFPFNLINEPEIVKPTTSWYNSKIFWITTAVIIIPCISDACWNVLYV